MSHICNWCGKIFPGYWPAMRHLVTWHLSLDWPLPKGTTLENAYRMADVTKWRD